MAETTVTPNNRAVVYRSKSTRERPRPNLIGVSMPMRSKTQNAAMHAAEAGRSTLGIPQSVGADFVNAQHGKSLKGLPTYVKKRERGGAVEAGEAYEVGEKGPEAFVPGVKRKAKPLVRRGRVSNKALDKRLGALERLEAQEHRYGGKDQQGIDASTR